LKSVGIEVDFVCAFVQQDGHILVHIVLHFSLFILELFEKGIQALLIIPWLLRQLLFDLVVGFEAIMQLSLFLAFVLQLFKKLSDATSLILNELLLFSLRHHFVLLQQLFHVRFAILKVITHGSVCVDLALLLVNLGLLLRSELFQFKLEVLLNLLFDVFRSDIQLGLFFLLRVFDNRCYRCSFRR